VRADPPSQRARCSRAKDTPTDAHTRTATRDGCDGLRAKPQSSKMHTRAACKERDGGGEDGRVVPLTLVTGGFQRRVERVGLIASVRHRGGRVPGGSRV
jgi:hypothetical protein